MATINHVICPNIPNTSLWRYTWTLTRALRKAGWKYKGSSNGTSKDITGDPALDYWGAGQVTAGPTSVTLTIGTPARGRASVSGLSGIVAADKGRFLCLTGSATPANNHYHQIEEIISSTEVKIDARTFAVAAGTESLTWTIRDTTYDLNTEWTASGATLNTIKCWWCAEGPAIVRIPITGAPTNGPAGQIFIRGENITQTSTGFQGEIIGHIWYPIGPIGYLIVNPRVRGTGAGVYGLSASGSSADIVGAMSGASVVDGYVGTAIQYNEEIVLWKYTDAVLGKQFGGFFDTVADANDRFSGTTRLTAATATIPPGGAVFTGPANFPSRGCVLRGAGSLDYIGGTGNVFWEWTSNKETNAINNRGLGLVTATDIIEEENWSQDGSWILAYANNYSIANKYGCEGYAFQRLNNTEPGDLYPFAYAIIEATQSINVSRTACNNPSADSSWALFAHWYWALASFSFVYAGGGACWKTWRSFGLGTREAFTGLSVGFLNSMYSRDYYAEIAYSGANNNFYYPETLETVPPYAQVRIKESPCLVLPWNSNNRFRKGNPKWMFAVQNGGRFDLWDDKKFIQLGSGTTGVINFTKVPGLLIGPWDGSTQQLAT